MKSTITKMRATFCYGMSSHEKVGNINSIERRKEVLILHSHISIPITKILPNTKV